MSLVHAPLRVGYRALYHHHSSFIIIVRTAWNSYLESVLSQLHSDWGRMGTHRLLHHHCWKSSMYQILGHPKWKKDMLKGLLLTINCDIAFTVFPCAVITIHLFTGPTAPPCQSFRTTPCFPHYRAWRHDVPHLEISTGAPETPRGVRWGQRTRPW